MIAAIRLWREGLVGALLVALGLIWLGKAQTERRNHRLEASLAAAGRVIEQERASVRAASARARAEDAARAARAERDQERISRETASEYQKQIADLRRRADALRVQLAPAGADSGGRGGPAVSGLPDAPGRADGAAGQAGLPAEDALIASEQALRLKALQDWVRAQGQVEREAWGGLGREGGR